MTWDECVAVDGVEISYRHGPWEVWCSWPHRGGRHEVVTLMRVRYRGTEAGLVLSTKRVNILSASAINQIILTMNRAVGEKQSAEIAEMIHEVCEDLMGWYQEGKAISQPDPSNPRPRAGWLVYPVWPSVGATAVVAAPGSYKSFIAEAIGVQVATGATVLNRNTKVRDPQRVLYLDWEATEDIFTERLAAICRGAGLALEPHLGYKQMTARLADVAIGLAEEIQRGQYAAVIVDSMSASIGGGMVDDDAVNSFWDATRTLAVPTLVLAHKSAENIQKRRKRFFGSIMSEARVRMAWNAEKAVATNHVVWECFKDNNTGHMGNKLGWELTMENHGKDDEQILNSAGVLGVNPDNIALTPETEPGVTPPQPTTASQIWDILSENGPMSAPEIAMRIGKGVSNVRSVLSRGKDDDQFQKDSVDRWSIFGAELPLA